MHLLTPVPDPPSIRDFYAFEAHVATARRSRGLEMEPDWYELPVFYFTNPAAVLGPDDEVVRAGRHGRAGLRARGGRGDRRRRAPTSPAADWLDVVAGFTVMNDWSARDLQRREMKLGLGPAKGKDFATTLGPVLVTPEELLDADGVPRGTMVARVNGEEWSRGELADLHFGWGDLIAHASRATRLRPGDVIGSGTVGTGCILELGLVHGRDRYPWLTSGDEVIAEVEGIGELREPYRLTAVGEGVGACLTPARPPKSCAKRSRRSSTSWPRTPRPTSESAWPSATPRASTSPTTTSTRPASRFGRAATDC